MKGYRFDDDSQSLAAAITITNNVVIQPGETIVLVETAAARPMDPARFRAWWGTNLPEQLKIVVYSGLGVGLSSARDALYLWNAAATANSDFICEVTFGAAPSSPRRTFVYNVDSPERQTPVPGLLTLLSAAGLNGAWAASNGDVGSPGRVIEPVQVQIAWAPNHPLLRWPTIAGRRYVVEARSTLDAGTWTAFTNVQAAGDYIIVTPITDSPAGFFRVGTILPFPEP